jgi:GAF domain-containing protein
MQPAPILPNESKRLAALRRYGILDIPGEADFDDFTRLASQICGTPIATITLVDAARQWFKSNIGLEASETPRDISFCGHAIAGNEILEVPNALEDERFRDNPLVIGDPNLRFYAGAPLITPDGLNIGALCVFDRTPHCLNSIPFPGDGF